MSNGVFTEVKRIIGTGELPQKVSNRLLAALVIESYGLGKVNEESIRVLQKSDNKWRAIAILLAAFAAVIGFVI